MVKELRINQQIRAREVRVIGDNGAQLGVMPAAQALQMARERGLDLVEVAPTVVPPVCRLLNYGKFRYEQSKKERKARKSQRTGLKEFRVRPRIKEYDLESKLKIMRKMLEDGDKVRVSLVFRGREFTHPEQGWKILKKLVEELKGVGVAEGTGPQEGGYLGVTFLPAAVKEMKETKETKETKVEKEVANAKAKNA